MKTAMQELIELLELNDKNEPMPYLIDSIKQVYISKEKEQIIDAHLEGWSDAYDYIYSDSNQQARQAEDYFDETYNQKK